MYDTPQRQELSMQEKAIITLLSILMYLGAACVSAEGSAKQRYLNPVFDAYNKVSNVVYANKFNAFSNQREALTMRIFEPKNDAELKRPLVILTPGGGFVKHDDNWMDDFGIELAKAGYVIAINRYRLSAGVGTPELFFNAVSKSVSDQRSVIEYFVNDNNDGNRYNVDLDLVFVGGHSAGAITSMFVAYTDASDDIPESLQKKFKEQSLSFVSTEQKKEFTIKGVVNMSGLIIDLALIDVGEPALLSIHGERDTVIRFDRKDAGFAATVIAEHVQKIGVANMLYVIPGGDHLTPADPLACPECIPLMKRFMFNKINF
ncbi:MAG: hypothetical protein COA42_12135 [Alteromonadaceae bacterium]|nr:MAG: hypothetical protein COA42_12135 [Alteromonadaceae bacterium]